MKYLNALNTINGLGPKNLNTLLNFFENPENIWNADIDALTKSGIEEKLAQKIIQSRKKINPDRELEKLSKENIRMVSIKNENYPALLKEIPNAPPLIYIKSSEKDFNFNLNPMIAVVGSRKFTQYGKQVAYKLSYDLAQAGITIVSGMALGVDAIAHRGALDAGGKTIAVLGSSLDDKNIGPKTNFQLSREIITNGCLMSDFPSETPASPGTFPARNRIMAGMTIGTLIIEAAEKSGTLITANLSLDFNREVFAVPGSIFSPASTGPNQLIQRGAKLITNIKDILEELNMQTSKEAKKVREINPENKEEEVILKLLNQEPVHINAIIKKSEMQSHVVSSTLSLLELKGFVKNIGGQNYILI